MYSGFSGSIAGAMFGSMFNNLINIERILKKARVHNFIFEIILT